MSAMHIAGQDLELNQHGHLIRFDDWNKEVAEALAEKEGLALSQSHWRVIDYLREYYSKFETSPSPRLIVKDVGHELTRNAPCTRRTLDALFPGGGCKQACRIAGLPEYYCHSC